jgi:hypothetical protein
MYRRSYKGAALFVLPLLFTVLLPTGCAAKQAVVQEPPAANPGSPEGLALGYGFREGKPLTYRSTSQLNETTEMAGGTRSRKIDRTIEFTVMPEATGREGHRLVITIDAMTASLSMMNRDMKREVGEVIGKSFEIALSPLGEESTLSGTEQLQYQLGPTDNESIVPDFDGLFPSLPRQSIQQGATWSGTKTIADISGGDVTITLESVHTLTGFETIHGMECAKITTTLKGDLSGKATQERETFEVGGSVSGRAVWYFAHGPGILVRSSRTIRTSGDVTQSGDRRPTSVPVTRELKVETEFIP